MKNSPSMNRRSFLKGALATGAVATAAVTGAGALAGCAAQPKGSADSTSKGQADGATVYEFEIAPDPIPDSDIAETVDADVVVIGAGFSGLCCALSAAENGASVALLERMDHVSGRGGSIYAMNSKLTKEKGYECSIEEIARRYKRMMGYHSYRVDGRKWMLHFNRSGEAMDWLIDRMTVGSSVGGYDLTPVMEHWYEDPENINGEFPGTHEFLDGPNGKGPDDNPQQDVCDNMALYCEKEGVDIRYETEAKQLVKDGDKVVGVVAKSGDGYVRFNGKKGVVIATGDFGQNKEMLEEAHPLGGAPDRVRRDLERHRTSDGLLGRRGHRPQRDPRSDDLLLPVALHHPPGARVPGSHGEHGRPPLRQRGQRHLPRRPGAHAREGALRVRHLGQRLRKRTAVAEPPLRGRPQGV